MMKTFSAKPEDAQKDWHIVDADGKTLGRLATDVAIILRSILIAPEDFRLATPRLRPQSLT